MVTYKNTGLDTTITNVTSSYTVINPSSITQEGFNSEDTLLIPNRTDQSSFIPFQDVVEFWIYDNNNNFLGGNYSHYEFELELENNSCYYLYILYYSFNTEERRIRTYDE